MTPFLKQRVVYIVKGGNMAVYRKQPTTFAVDNVSRKRLTSFLPFGGLEINENPLTTSAGSTSDALNMVVDDNSFLTLRPRIIDDPQYLIAKQNMLQFLENTNDFVWGGQAIKVKDGFLFVAGNNPSPTVVRLTITHGVESQQQQSALIVEITLNNLNSYFDFGYYVSHSLSISETISEMLYQLNATWTGTQGITNNWTWTSDNETYIEFTANTIGPRTGLYAYDASFNIETFFTATFNVVQGVENSKMLLYVASNDPTTVTEVDIDETSLAILNSFDDFLIFPEKDYFRFVYRATGVHYKFYLKEDTWTFEAIEPYIPTYKLSLSSVESISDAIVYEDLNILSDKYKLSVLYSKESGMDLSVFTSHAVDISGNPYIYEELEGMSGKEIVYYSASGYIYFLATDYTAVAALGAGTNRTLNFTFYSFDSKQETLAFAIKVYGTDGSYSDGISKQNLAKLYSSTVTKDYNQNDVYKLMYDATTHGLKKVKIILAGGMSTAVTSINIEHYDIATKTFYETLLTIGGASTEYDWTWIYTQGSVAIIFNGNATVHGVGLVAYSLSEHTCHYLIGQSGPDTKFLPAALPSGFDITGHNVTAYFFASSQKTYLITGCQLDYFLDQDTSSPASDIVLTPSGDNPFTKDMIKGCYYYDIGTSIDIGRMADLKVIANYTPKKSNYNAICITGTQALLYTVDAQSYRSEPIVRIPITIPTSADSLSLDSFFSAHPEFSLESMMVTAWGMPILFGYGTYLGRSDLLIAKVDMDSSISNGVVQYWYQPLDIGTVHHGLVFATDEAFDVISSGGTVLRRVVVTKDELEYTYDIANNEVNPLKLSAEVIASHNEYANAYRFPSTRGTTLINSSCLYYNDKYVFITEPLNYDYIPTIHCHKTVQPIRFASSYLQEIGVIYERNNIEYVSLTDNPFRDTGITSQYIAHSRVFIFNSVEQRAIDYLPNGHLITFTGITVYVNNGGIYALNFDANTPQDSERKASLISAPINAKLLKEDMSTCILANLDPYVLFMFPKSDYTAVYALKILSGLWFYWELPTIVEKVIDDNRHLRLISGTRYIEFNDSSTVISVPMSTQMHEGSVEQYLDFDTDHIKWYWKSQLLTFGSITSQKQITDTFFTFVNPNAGITFDTDTFDITQNKITTQNFGLRFYTYKELISEAPVVAYEGKLNIINNLRRRTYLNRFKYCQLLCYNIEDEDAPSDKVRIANIAIAYKYLTGGR